jgi:hypothetical protein
MAEEAKRLAPKSETLRELFLRSGNLCAYPGCNKLMLSESAKFVGQLCHIEAAEKGGERFNENMTNEQRRAAANLMLMCYEHHTETNDVNAFPISRLQQIKADHERRFSHPDRAILSTLKDYTLLEDPTYAQNLRKMNRILGWGLSDEELRDQAADLREYLERFARVPAEVRNFLGGVAMRMRRMRDLPAVHTARGRFSCPSIRFDDLEQAFQINEETMSRFESQLDSYNLGGMTHIPDQSYDREFLGLYVSGTGNGWCLWRDLAEFCEKAQESIEAFSVDLDFARLDEDDPRSPTAQQTATA